MSERAVLSLSILTLFQMAAMFLVDRTEFLMDRVGFRQFIQTLVPGYTMPTPEQFRSEIIPRVAKQLQHLALFREELQRNKYGSVGKLKDDFIRLRLLMCIVNSGANGGREF